MKRYFITGTDTDCGKTYLTCKLVEFFKRNNQQVLAIKPVVSGCSEINNQFTNSDILSLEHYNRHNEIDISPWRFKMPVSPHIAAEAQEQNVTVEQITDYCMSPQFSMYDSLLIEGAGGLMVPLNRNQTWIDFLRYSQIPVIFVVGIRLGCLNHALLTELALNKHSIHCAGWVANCVDPNMLASSENIKTLKNKLSMPFLSEVSYGGTLTNTPQLVELLPKIMHFQ